MGDEVDRELQDTSWIGGGSSALGGGAAFAGAARRVRPLQQQLIGRPAPGARQPAAAGRRRPQPVHLGGLRRPGRRLQEVAPVPEHHGDTLKYITQPEEVPTVLKGPGGDKWDMSYGDNVVLTRLQGSRADRADDPGRGPRARGTDDRPSRSTRGRTTTAPTTAPHGRGGSRASPTGRDNVPEPTSWQRHPRSPSTRAASRPSTAR